MSTNFYARRIIPSENGKATGGYIMSEDMENAIESDVSKFDSIDQYVSEGNEIHLGKRSAGWKFIWNPNVYRVNDSWDFTYPLTKQGIADFLNQEGMVINDEYGRMYKPDEFWEMAFNWCVDGLDAKEYYTNPNYKAGYYHPDSNKTLEKWRSLGFKPEYHNFYSDEMVFSTSVNVC